MKTKPELGIKDPYALDDNQFKAAVDLLKAAKQERRRVLVGLHQRGAGLQVRRLGARYHVAGHHEHVGTDKAP
jgi:hypothetical protein